MFFKKVTLLKTELNLCVSPCSLLEPLMQRNLDAFLGDSDVTSGFGSLPCQVDLGDALHMNSRIRKMILYVLIT